MFKKFLNDKRVKWRLVLLMLTAVTSISALILWEPSSREQVVRYAGYYFTLISTVLFFGWLALSLKDKLRNGALNTRVLFYACCITAVGCCSIFVHADFGYKIAMDEYILASTAKNLHEVGQVLTDVNLLRDESSGEQFVADTFVDKRLWLYPFFVSTLHDLLGYSVLNSFILNALLGSLLLLLAYHFGRYVGGAAGGVLAVLLLAGLPLLSQSATSGGLELLGMVLTVVVMLAATCYLKEPTRLREGVLALSTVLLAYSRYELALFVLPVAIIIVIGWIRRGRMLISYATILAPVLLIAYGLHILAYLDQPAAWELTRGAESAFSFAHILANLPHAIVFLFSFDGSLANSPMLGVIGVIGLVGVPWIIKHRIGAKKVSELAAVELCLLVFLPFLALQFVLILGFHASRLDSPFVSRYSLLFYWLLAISSLLLVSHLASQFKTAWRYAITGSACFLLVYTIPVNANPPFSRENFIVNEDKWLGELVEAFATDALWVDRFLLTHTLREESAVGLSTCIASADVILKVVDDGLYDEVLYVERLILHGSDYQPESLQAEAMRERFHMETILERSFRPYNLTRICRLVGKKEVKND